MHRIGMAEDAECRWFMEDDESAAYLLCRCPDLANFRFSIFGRADVRSEESGDLGNLSSRAVIRYLRESSILDEL